MDSKSWFLIGAKLIGLFYLIFALPVLLGIIPMLSYMTLGWDPTPRMFGAQAVLLLLSPILLGGVGLQLLRSGSLLSRLALKEGPEEEQSQTVEFFTVGVKLYGVYICVANIPTLLSSLSHFLFLANSSYGVGRGVAEGLGLRTNFLPALVSIMFGVLLFFRGELLSRWAFADRQRVETSE